MDEEGGSVEVKGHSGMAAVMARLLSGEIHQKDGDDRSTSQDRPPSGQDSNAVRSKKRGQTHISNDGDGIASAGDVMMSTIKQKRRRIQTDAASISDVVKKYHQLPQGMNFEEERELQRVATRGVVQLFNAVSRQQKEIESKLKQAGSSEGKQARVMTTGIDKGSFIDMLKNGGVSQPSSSAARKKKKTLNASTDSSAEPSWAILRDDYMKKSKLKDWDTKNGELGDTNDDLPSSSGSEDED